MAAERSPAACAARAALFENGREFMTLTIPRVDTGTVGGLFAPLHAPGQSVRRPERCARRSDRPQEPG